MKSQKHMYIHNYYMESAHRTTNVVFCSINLAYITIHSLFITNNILSSLLAILYSRMEVNGNASQKISLNNQLLLYVTHR